MTRLHDRFSGYSSFHGAWMGVLVVLGSAVVFGQQGDATPPSVWAERGIEGWRVLVSQALWEQHPAATQRAIDLLTRQLQEIGRVVPAPAVTRLREVPLYFSPPYPGIQPKAEYHSEAGWLRDHGRDPSMEKAVEFTNVLIFEAETRRMPNFALHELAHAYHDRELAQGFGNEEVRVAFERARASGSYEQVERQDALGRKSIDRAYAMTNPQEYFAEITEAYFSRNDFFPFCREELERHDPMACRMLRRLWGCLQAGATTAPAQGAATAAE